MSCRVRPRRQATPRRSDGSHLGAGPRRPAGVPAALCRRGGSPRADRGARASRWSIARRLGPPIASVSSNVPVEEWGYRGGPEPERANDEVEQLGIARWLAGVRLLADGGQDI